MYERVVIGRSRKLGAVQAKVTIHCPMKNRVQLKIYPTSFLKDANAYISCKYSC